MAKTKAAGSSKNGRDSAGRRLGWKLSDGQFGHAGSIIFRQRGTKIHPGDNVGRGNDDTLYALIDGYVKYADKRNKKIVSVYPERIITPKGQKPTKIKFVEKAVVASKAKPEMKVQPKFETKIKPEPKPKIVNGIDSTKKHVVIKQSEIDVYNYDIRRKQWHINAGYNETAINCSGCKIPKHASVLKENKDHICYTCFIKKSSK